MLSFEQSSQRLVTCFHDYAFPHPLPKLSLRRPELLSIATDNKGRLLLPLFLPGYFLCTFN